MGINLGAFIAPLICGWVGARVNWRYGFALAGVGMTIGILQYVLGSRHLGDAGRSPATRDDSKAGRQFLLGAAVVIGIIAAGTILAWQGILSAREIADASGGLLLAVVLVFFIWLFTAGEWTSIERKRLVVVGALFVASTVFWSVFEQAGSSMNLFAQRNTDNDLGFFQIPAPWYQSVNALFIITLAPVFAALWLRLGAREPSSPAKFAWGLGLVGGGFLVLAAGAGVAETGVRVSPMWLIVTYLLHTMGELCLSPVGLSAMTKLAPARVAGLMMGVWFLSISAGNYLGGRLAALYGALPLPTLFGTVGMFAIAAGILLAFCVKPMIRLMSGVR
jgi:POT family proton-dependent oligopeptide transporter